MRKINTDSEIS